MRPLLLMNRLKTWLSVMLLSLSILAFSQQDSEEAYLLNNLKLDKKVGDFVKRYDDVPKDFYRLIIQNREYIADSAITPLRKIVYQNHLMDFLELPFDKELLIKGSYSSILRYNIFLIKWSEENTLYENLIQYPNLSLRALSLYASDSAAYYFLDSMASIIPDNILRQSEIYEDQWYAEKIWLKIGYFAPNYLKRYFIAPTAIGDFVLSSKDSKITQLRSVYYNMPFKTRAYLMLDDITNQGMSIKTADSVSANTNLFFDSSIEVLKRINPDGLFTLNKELQYICVSIARSLSLKSDNPDIDFAEVSSYSKEKIFAILTYGHQDLVSLDFNYLITALMAKGNKPLPANFLKNLSKEHLASLIKMTQLKNQLSDIIKIAGIENEGYLLSLLSYEAPFLDQSPDKRGISLPINHRPYDIDAIMSKITAPTIVENSRETERIEAVKSQNVELSNSLETEEVAMLEKANPIVPVKSPATILPITFTLTEEDRQLLLLKQNVFESLQQLVTFIDNPLAKEFLEFAAEKDPEEVLKKVDIFKGKYYSGDIVERCILNAPVILKKYLFNPSHPVAMILKNSKNKVVQKMIAFNEPTSYKTRPYLLINDVANEKLTPEEAIEISSKSDRLFREMAKIVSSKKYIGGYSIEKEMSFYALRFIRSINDKVNQPENLKFASLEGLTFEEIYMITVFGREEVFNATFNGIFNHLEKSLSAASPQFIENLISFPRFRVFIALCANNNKLSRLFSYFSEEQKAKAIKSFVKNIGRVEGVFDEAVNVSETIANTSDPSIINLLQSNIKAEYIQCDSIQQPKCMVLYGILAGLIKEKVVTDKQWFFDMSLRYPSGELTTLKLNTMVNNNILIERMYFYDDDDGRDSYTSFINTFRSKENWRVEEYYAYAKISSLSGTPIEIYANKPTFETSGDNAISTLFSENAYQPTIIIHRGHSFHTERTLERIPSSTKLLFLGSCGGFYKAAMGLKNAPEAHVLATRQIGTKQINDPLIFSINETFRHGEDIQWPTFWNTMKMQLGSYSLFYDYVPPHKNIETLFQNAYYKTLGL